MDVNNIEYVKEINDLNILEQVTQNTKVLVQDDATKYISLIQAVKQAVASAGEIDVKDDLNVSGEVKSKEDFIKVRVSETTAGSGGIDVAYANGFHGQFYVNSSGELKYKVINPNGDVISDNKVMTTKGDEAVVSGNATIEGDVKISGDLFVSGTTHTVDEETIVAQGNTITLRANNNTAIKSTEVAGTIVNKYDGTSDLYMVADNEGTMRVGTGNGTSTSYQNIAYSADDNKWYSYNGSTYTELSTQPEGILSSWSEKTEDAPYTKYASAVFTKIDKASLEPLMTRDEETSMNDKSLMYWDSDNAKAKTVSKPSNDNSILVSRLQNGIRSFEWTTLSRLGGVGVAFIGTRTQYDVAKTITEGNAGFIPSGALVIITDENNYLEA